MRLKKRTRAILLIAGAGLLALALSCGYFFFHSRQTLRILLSPPDALPATDIFGTWLTFEPGRAMTGRYLQAYLSGLDYRAVEGEPAAPGEYRSDNENRWTIYARGFRYPDKDFPSPLPTNLSRFGTVPGAVNFG